MPPKKGGNAKQDDSSKTRRSIHDYRGCSRHRIRHARELSSYDRIGRGDSPSANCLHAVRTYLLKEKIMHDSESITCPQCGMTSSNLNDVRERYCENCHQFHDDMNIYTRFSRSFSQTRESYASARLRRGVSSFF